MIDHENQAIRFLKAQREKVEGDLVELGRRELDFLDYLSTNAAAKAEKQSALNDIDQLLDAIDPYN